MVDIPIRDGGGTIRQLEMISIASNVYIPAHVLYATTLSGSAVALVTSSNGSLNVGTLSYEHSFIQLSSSGTWTSGIMVNLYRNHTIQIIASGIITNIVIRIEGSSNNINWGNLSPTGTDITINTNGTHLITLSNIQITYIRVNFISESGGLSAIINTDYMGG